MHQNLSSGGYAHGEFPVLIRVIYEDTYGDRYTYQLGVYYQGGSESSVESHNYDCPSGLVTCLPMDAMKVTQDVWFTLPDIDLLALTPIPAKLLKFQMGSSGWDFEAQFDNVQVTGSDSASCGLPVTP